MNLKVCLTGSFPEKRELFKKRLIEAGYHVVGSVTPQLDYLVAGENAGSKVEKAKDLGIMSISYQTMCETANITPCVYPMPPITVNCPSSTVGVDSGWYDYDKQMTINLPLVGDELQYKWDEGGTWRKGIVACIFEQDPIIIDSVDGMPYRILTINNVQPIDWDKNVKKTVDLKWLVNSNIDCEFSNNISDHRTVLVDTARRMNDIGQIARSTTDHTYQMCRPRLNHPMLFTDKQLKLIPNGFDWTLNPHNTVNIVTFKGLQNGYCWPWERKN